MFKPKGGRSYTWARVATPQAPLAHAMAMQPLAATPHPSFRAALASVGVPTTNKSPEEELVDLLQDAAEIEHGLMLQYLYAAYSAKSQVIKGALRTIAIEEMGHFLSVQNLLIACGAAPYFGRAHWGDPSPFQPYGFKLEPLSIGSLAKYAIGEMPDPDQVAQGIKADLPTIMNEADTAAGAPVASHRVGLLYAKIYWLLRDDDQPLADPAKEPWLGFPVGSMAATPDLKGRHVRGDVVADIGDRNALPEHWIGNYTSVIVAPISGRESARKAIARIAAQGEGFANTPQSHFERLVEAWRIAHASPDFALPAATNPHLGHGTGEEIASVLGRRFAGLSDGLYKLVLLCTAANLLLPAGMAAAIRRQPARAAIMAMREGLGAVATVLTTLPLRDGSDTPVCGLPFSPSPAEVEPQLAAIIASARASAMEMHALIESIGQADDSGALAGVAESIGATLDNEIMPLLESLPV